MTPLLFRLTPPSLHHLFLHLPRLHPLLHRLLQLP